MRFKSFPIIGLLSVAWLAVLAGCDGDSSNPTAPPMPQAPGVASSSFRVVGAGQDQAYSFNNGANTVFCSRNAGWASLWIRLAEQATGNGGNGPHIDIDLCNHAGGGDFSPKDPMSTSCGGAKTWDIFWHGADGSVFFNSATAPSCTLRINQNGTQLSGMFECRDLVEDGGSRTLDILDGTFDCMESG